MAATLSYGVQAMGISPGVIVIGNVTPGVEVPAFPADGTGIKVENDGDNPLVVTLTVFKPTLGGVLRWEKGYEEIPDASWCSLGKTELEAPAKGFALAKLSIKVPDKPEYYNRKWMVAVVCEPKRQDRKAGTGIAMRVASRIGIETLPKVDVNLDAPGLPALSLVPSLLSYDGCILGETFPATLKIRNNDKAQHTYMAERLDQAEPDAEKQTRYFRASSNRIVKDWWVAPVESFKLGAAETKELKLSVTVPKTAAAGQVYEEIVFLKDDAQRYDFFRLRMRVAGSAEAPKK